MLCLRRKEGRKGRDGKKGKGKEGKEGRIKDLLNQSFIPFLIFSIYENSKACILGCDRSDLCIEDHIDYISHLL